MSKNVLTLKMLHANITKLKRGTHRCRHGQGAGWRCRGGSTEGGMPLHEDADKAGRHLGTGLRAVAAEQRQEKSC